jgi:Uma2 family endonuclease
MPTLTEAPTATTTYRRFPPERVLGRMSVEEWAKFLAASKHKSHYVYGEVIEMAGASVEHNLIAMNFAVSLRNALEAAGSTCEVFGSDQKVFVDSGLYYFPDLCVDCDDWLIDPYEALQNPSVIVEVMSESTEKDDRTDKFREYQQITSLRHYVLIDQARIAVTHFEKLAQGLWAIVGDFRELDDHLTIALKEHMHTVSLAQIYRRITLF